MWALCLSLSGLPATVQAAASGNEARARTQFRAAQKSFDLGEFAAALDHYAEAYRLQPLPAFLFNMAQCHRLLGNYERAAFFYQRFLDLSPSDSPNIETARDLLKDVQEKLQPHASTSASELSPPPVGEAPAFPLAALPAAPREERPSSSTPVTQKWWFWTAVGVAVVGAVGVGYAAATNPKPPSGTLADINAR